MPGSRTLYAHTQPVSYSGKKKDSQWWKPQSDLHSVLRTQDPTPPSSDPTGPASPSGPLRTPRPPPPCQWPVPAAHGHTHFSRRLPPQVLRPIHSFLKQITVGAGDTVAGQDAAVTGTRPRRSTAAHQAYSPASGCLSSRSKASQGVAPGEAGAQGLAVSCSQSSWDGYLRRPRPATLLPDTRTTSARQSLAAERARARSPAQRRGSPCFMRASLRKVNRSLSLLTDFLKILLSSFDYVDSICQALKTPAYDQRSFAICCGQHAEAGRQTACKRRSAPELRDAHGLCASDSSLCCTQQPPQTMGKTARQ